MKKVILLIIMVLGLTLNFESSGISVTSFKDAKAQSQTGCWNPNSGQGGGFFNWLANAASNVATAVTNVANAIGDFFSGSGDGGDGGEEFGEENGEDDWFEPSGSPDNFFNPMDDPWFQPPGFGQDEWDIMNNLDYWYGVYSNGGNPPTQDCNGVWGGTAFTGSCGICIGGSTSIPTCYVDTPRVDTVKPIKIPCDSAANARGARLTRIRDSINNNPDVLRVKDSALNSPNEAGVSITSNAGTYGSFNFKTGTHNNVEVLSSSPGQNIVAGIHSHGKGGGHTAANSPSPADLYHLLEGYQFNNNFIADFVFSHDNTEWALAIDDHVAANNFLSNNSSDSTLIGTNWDTTRKLTNGETFYNQYLSWAAYLYREQHYPLEMSQAYANVQFTDINLGTGVKFYRRENGQFKELSYEITRDTAGNVTGIKITICQ